VLTGYVCYDLAAIAIVPFNFCQHGTDLCGRVFDILPFATAILRLKQRKDGASELRNLYSSKVSLFSMLLCFIQCSSTQHRPPPTCLRYSTIRYSSDKTTFGFGKRKAAILEFYWFPVSILTCVSSNDRRRSYDVISFFSTWPPAAILDMMWVILDYTRSAIAVSAWSSNLVLIRFIALRQRYHNYRGL